MKRNFLLLISLISTLALCAKSSTTKWTGSISQQKVFIENKSQFDSKNKLAGGQILFGTDEGPAMIYFTKTGLTYRLQKIEPKAHKEEFERSAKKRESEEEEHEAKVTTDVIHMQWENANVDAQVVAEQMLPNYSSYSVGKTNINHVKGFKKLIYKNLYPNIDIEYVYDAREGIKYSIVLHPGADVTNVKMKYTGNKKVSLDADGNVHVGTLFGDIIDHAPDKVYSTSDNSKIVSGFVKNGNTISFKLAEYDHSKEVIIDPWTTTPSMPASNTVYYIKSDSIGNAYIYGGTTPFRLIKYNTAGTLQWTYNTPWGGGSSPPWFGALIVDRAGNSFITEGSDAALSKIDPSGNLVWSNTPTQGTLALEYWAMDFNCDQSQLYVGGTRDIPFSFSFYATVFQMNMTDGSITNYLNVEAPGLHIGGANEVRSMCSAPNGNLYYLSLDSVGSLSQSLVNRYGQMSGYSFPYYMPYSNGGTGQGQNNIRATALYLYTTDGATVHKRDIATGNILLSASIPAGSQYNNSGVAIDSCGNVYVGSQSSVVKYDANLNLITSATTPAAVYDVSIGANGDILACGNSFAVALAMSSCSQVEAICVIPFTATITPQNFCTGTCQGSATANTFNGHSPYTYSWSNGQTTQTVSGLCAGPYSVTVTDSLSATASATATVVQDTVHVTISTQASCGIGNGSATATITGGSAGATYSWSNGATTQTISGIDTGYYSVTATLIGGCSAIATGHVGLATLGVNITTLPTTCGNGSGSASAIITGGGTGATYSWSNGATTPSISNVDSGSYSVTVTVLGGCSATTSGVVHYSGGLTLTLSSTPASCGLNNGTASVAVAGGNGNYTYTWNNHNHSATISSLQTDTFTVTVSEGVNCSATGSVFVGNTSPFTLIATSTTSTCGAGNVTATVQVTGGTAPFIYGWSNGASTATVNNLSAGPYIVTVTDSTTCSATASIMVRDTGEFTLSDTSTSAVCGSATGTALVQATGGSTPYTYSWSNGATTAAVSNLSAGPYAVTVTDSSNCRVTAAVVVDSSSSPTVTITQDKPGICPGDTAHICAPDGFLTYRWNEGDSASCIIVTQAGTYWVTVSAGLNCTAVSNQLTEVLYPQPTVHITESGATLTANTTTGISYQWYHDSATIQGATSQTYSAQLPGGYMVIIMDSNGCQAHDTITYNQPLYAFPDAFSPNGDGKNDFFYPTIRGDIKVLTFHIYNRWGQLIYDNPSEGWDGKFKGKEQPSGTYIYYCVLRIPDATVPSGLSDVNKQGAVTLLR